MATEPCKEHSHFYYKPDTDNFYCGICNKGQGNEFHAKHYANRHTYPNYPIHKWSTGISPYCTVCGWSSGAELHYQITEKKSHSRCKGPLTKEELCDRLNQLVDVDIEISIDPILKQCIGIKRSDILAEIISVATKKYRENKNESTSITTQGRQQG